MNKGMLTVGVIMLAIMALLLINVISNYSTGGELDYYLLKETTEAAMEDSVDMEYYRLNSLYRIDKEKFVESFLRRFADSVDNTRTYEISFYDINEVPPKVSVNIDSLTVLSFSGSSANISTNVDMILETDYTHDQFTEKSLKDLNNDAGKPIDKRSNYNKEVSKSDDLGEESE